MVFLKRLSWVNYQLLFCAFRAIRFILLIYKIGFNRPLNDPSDHYRLGCNELLRNFYKISSRVCDSVLLISSVRCSVSFSAFFDFSISVGTT